MLFLLLSFLGVGGKQEFKAIIKPRRKQADRECRKEHPGSSKSAVVRGTPTAGGAASPRTSDALAGARTPP